MICIHLMGGLGNQMFQYAALKSMMLENDTQGIIELSGVQGIKKRSHNVYSLNYFSIDKNIKIVDKKYSIRGYMNYFIYIVYCILLKNNKNKIKIIEKIQKKINSIGCYCVPDGYVQLEKIKCKNNYMFGYFQSYNYFSKYEKEIREDLQVSKPILDSNLEIKKDIDNSNSVCVHIRRGDYVNSEYDVCDIQYYIKAMDLISKKIENCKFYIFSNDIEWAKQNIKRDNIIFVEKNNPNYEELRLMYSCKHFIMSNSSFSWWAQFLSSNANKIVIAPSKWKKNENEKSDIYCDDWIIIDV